MDTPRRKVAIFDIDGTIFRSSLLIELVEELIAEGIFTPDVRNIYARDKQKWLDRKGDYETYITSVVTVFRRNVEGVRFDDFFRVAKRVVALHKNRVYHYTRNLVRELKKKKYYVLAISHSPKTAVDMFCKNLGFTKVYGLMYEVDGKGRFTGAMMHEDIIFDKSKVLQRAVEKENLTLRGSVGVGDTESDIRFLELVEKPICFNPNQKLYRTAKRKGWKIVVERKDVVYEGI
ncbi:MAG: HAD-IB family phosphatase [Patescibacteria group bacterium]|nr:HAD-IB family phosphatase [Patescibacteria group bacterium]